jgi:hypothetical protein
MIPLLMGTMCSLTSRDILTCHELGSAPSLAMLPVCYSAKIHAILNSRTVVNLKGNPRPIRIEHYYLVILKPVIELHFSDLWHLIVRIIVPIKASLSLFSTKTSRCPLLPFDSGVSLLNKYLARIGPKENRWVRSLVQL